jgi:hypothetical protein
MNKQRDITKEDLKKALRQMSINARRQNKALGLDTLYEKDGYLVKLDSMGKEHRVKKSEKRKNPAPSRVFDL